MVVVVPYFTGLTDADGVHFQKGLADFITSDLVSLADGSLPGGGRCGYKVREITRLAEVQREIDLSQSRYADPTTRITRNFLVPDVEIRGTLTQVDDRYDYVTRLVDARTGEDLDTIEGSISLEDWGAGADALARDLSKAICRITDVYEVRLDLLGTGTFATHDGARRSAPRCGRGGAARAAGRSGATPGRSSGRTSRPARSRSAPTSTCCPASCRGR